MSDRYNAELDPQTDIDDEWTTERSYQELYAEGIKYFKASGFYFERTLQGPYIYHEVYVISKPKAIKGVSYPASYLVLQLINDPEHIENLQRLVLNKKDADEQLYKFWEPILRADPYRRKPAYGHVLNLIKADSENRRINTGKPFEMGISVHPKGLKGYPKKWIPEREWFDPKLQDLTIQDVFTIFPAAELKVLELILGRLVVGRTNNIPVDQEEPVKHTSRMAAIIVGFDPGTGKSTLFNYLNNALGKCGYRQSTFRNLGDRFGLGPVAESDWAYKDDVSPKSFKHFLGSETAKILVTNGQVKCEQKGVDGVIQDSHCVVFLNTNSYDPRTIYELDPGTADRIKLLQTLSEGEINAQNLEGLSADSPNTKPFNHIPWLSKKLGVDEESLFLWVCRLAADRFLELISVDPASGVNELEREVRSLSNQLTLALSKDTVKQVLSYLFCCGFLSGMVKKRKPPTFTQVAWGRCFRAAHHMNDSKYTVFHQYLHDDWLAKDRPNVHPWLGFYWTERKTFETAANKITEAQIKQLGNTLADVYRQSFGAVFLRTGFRFSSDLVWLSREWELLTPYLKDLYQVIDVAIDQEVLPEETIDQLIVYVER